MELPEIGKLQDLDSPHSKDTYRTVKPPDRCVISYNFQQNNSLNFTHNLLIGMFNDTTKKVSKNQSLNSLENPKNKLFSILPNSKKINRQQGSTIAKVYDSKVVPKRYINPVSPQKQRFQSQTDYKNFQKNQLQSFREEILKPKHLEISHQDLTLQHENNSPLSKMPIFNENRERKLSPYSNKTNLKKQKTLNKSKIQDHENSLAKKTDENGENNRSQHSKSGNFSQSHYEQPKLGPKSVSQNLFQDRNNLSANNFLKKGNNTFHIKEKENQLRKQARNQVIKRETTGSNSPNKEMQSNSNSNSFRRQQEKLRNPKQMTHDQRKQQLGLNLEQDPCDQGLLQNQDRNQLSLNQSEENDQNLRRNSMESDSMRRSMERQSNLKTQQKIMSKKEVQDQQLRQLQQKIRKEESGIIKKGHFKVSKQSKQVLPFNADVEPLLRDQHNRNGKKLASSSKLINERSHNTTSGFSQMHTNQRHYNKTNGFNGQERNNNKTNGFNGNHNKTNGFNGQERNHNRTNGFNGNHNKTNDFNGQERNHSKANGLNQEDRNHNKPNGFNGNRNNNKTNGFNGQERNHSKANGLDQQDKNHNKANGFNQEERNHNRSNGFNGNNNKTNGLNGEERNHNKTNGFNRQERNQNKTNGFNQEEISHNKSNGFNQDNPNQRYYNKTNRFNQEQNDQPSNKMNSTFQKTQSANKNQFPKNETHSLQKAKNSNGSVHQVKQAKAKEYSVNEFVKGNKGSVNESKDLKNGQSSMNGVQKVPEIKKFPTNLRGKKDELKRSSYKKSGYNENSNIEQQQEPLKTGQNADLTQNHKIKGFKIPQFQKAKNNFNTLSKNNSQQLTSKNQKNDPQQTNKNLKHDSQQPSNSQRKEDRNRPNLSKQNNNGKQKKLEQNQTNNSAKLNKKPQTSLTKDKQRNHGQNSKNVKSLQKQNGDNRLSNDTSRTAKINRHFNPSKSINSSQNQQQRSLRGPKTEQSFSKSPSKPSVARQGKDKSYYNKDWKQAELQKAMKQKKNSKKRRQSKLNLQKKVQSARKTSNLKPKRVSKTAQIDLDAQQEDKFGLLAQKNVASNKNKNSKARNQAKKEKKKENQQIGEIKQQSEGSIKSNEDNSVQDYESHEEEAEDSSNQHGSQEAFEGQQQKQRIDQQDIENEGIDPKDTQHEQIEPKLLIVPVIKNQNTKAKENAQKSQRQQCKELQKVSEGVHQIQQLIQQNGQLSRIDSVEDNLQDRKVAAETQKTPTSKPSKQENERQEKHLAVLPIASNKQNNLQELLIATQQAPPHTKSIQPILDHVQLELQSNEQRFVEKKTKQQEKTSKLNEGFCVDQEKEKINEQLEVNLPLPKLEFTEAVAGQKILSRTGQQNETDYQEEQLDKIGQIPNSQVIKEETNKNQDFFQFNLKENSKISDTINLTANMTKYQPIDKNITHYDRAPILSFLYDMPNQFENFSVPFFPSANTHQLFKNAKFVSEIGEEIIDQAVSILMSLDPWIIERVFQPYQDKNGKIGIWLYCHGKWTLFLENKDTNYRKILQKVVLKALELLHLKFELQSVLKLVSGVRVMRLKSTKKKVFTQLQFSLKKGHVLKALTSKSSKWGERLFTVANVEVTKDLENVLQIKEQNETYWVKQQKFKQIFQHFLLICVRKSHFWTNRYIEHKPSHKTVIQLTSSIPAHGSITLFYPSQAPTSLLLYKELQSKVLKYMGKIQEKNNQNGNLYFEFRLHGTYALFLQAPESCLLAIQSTAQLEVSEPQYVLSQTLKNSECQYVELSNQIKRKSNSKQPNRNGETLQRLRQKFINLVAKK